MPRTENPDLGCERLQPLLSQLRLQDVGSHSRRAVQQTASYAELA